MPCSLQLALVSSFARFRLGLACASKLKTHLVTDGQTRTCESPSATPSNSPSSKPSNAGPEAGQDNALDADLAVVTDAWPELPGVDQSAGGGASMSDISTRTIPSSVAVSTLRPERWKILSMPLFATRTSAANL